MEIKNLNQQSYQCFNLQRRLKNLDRKLEHKLKYLQEIQKMVKFSIWMIVIDQVPLGLK
jgi:hypothetical protein